jgi:hypothetical protein
MFIDENSQQRPDEFSGFERDEDKTKKTKGEYIVYLIYTFLALAIFIILYFATTPETQVTPQPDPEPIFVATTTSGLFPLDPDDNGDNRRISSTTSDIQAEKLTFGHFYEKPSDDFEASLTSYELPVNIKIDVSNYYELSRKVSLDDYIDEINKNGFAVLDNQFSDEAKDFFAMNRLLSSKEIPVVVTSDLIFYYYQNILKEVYRDIQKNAFYQNVWDINKNLYDASLARYRQRRLELGSVNDPILEAARLEVAYFAVALEILVPTNNQVNKNETTGLKDFNKFNEMEADSFSFSLPSYLEDDVLREVENIRAAKGEMKSPVLLYPKNYDDFVVPADYKYNAKLNNFYLAMKWMNSNFPLYYKTEDCPDCLLDKNDWLVNLIAANFITKDLYDNQDTKNQWAVVYKFISFFSGLRSELTYLHYNDVMVDLFGEDYSIENIFSLDNVNREENIKNIQNKIAEFSFPEIKGSFDRNDLKNNPRLGMRILQEAYWPNDYLFNQLVGEDMLAKKQLNHPDRVVAETECLTKERDVYRCKSIGLDVINIVNPVSVEDEYFFRNSDYLNYDEKSKKLGFVINNFDKHAVNSSIYWLSLDLATSLYVDSEQIVPVFQKNKEWRQHRVDNTFMGAWANLHLPPDYLGNYFEQTSRALGNQLVCDMYNYVEPNIEFISEIIARNDMLIEMLDILNVSKTANATAINLKEFNGKMKTLLAISKKELSGIAIDNDDCKFLNSFIKHKIVESPGNKRISSKDPKVFNYSIDGLKIVALVYNSDGKLILALGPVFKYQED